MASPFKQETQSFFSANNSNMFGLDDFAKKNEERLANLPKFNYRGKDAYNKVVNNGVKAPYVKNQGTNKKYPYLSSKHHTGDIFNPMETSIRDKDAMTIAEENKLAQDNVLSGNFDGDQGQGTEASYFGDSFDRNSEKQAKIAVERHEYLTNVSKQGEGALNNALNTKRMVPNKNGVMINAGRLVDELYPMDSMSAKNLDGSYAANPAGQSSSNISDFQTLADNATAAQNTADTNRRGFNDIMNKAKNMESPDFSEFYPRFKSKFIPSTGFDPKSGV